MHAPWHAWPVRRGGNNGPKREPVLAGTRRLEEVRPKPGGPLQVRPVLRLTGWGVHLTRIFPEDRSTSMLLRLRPGWGTLKAALLGIDEQPKRCAGLRAHTRDILLL